MSHKTIDIYIKISDAMHGKRLLETLLSDSGSNSDSDNSGQGNNDDEEVLVDVPFIDFNSDVDEESE